MHFIKTLTPACLLLAALSVGVGRAGDIKGKVTAQGIKSPENIAVYVDAIPGKAFPAPAEHAVMDQRKLTFIPHVLVVLKGTTVDFLNSDAVGHNVYWPSISGNKKLAHNMGTWPQGEKKSFTFNDLGVAPLLCNVHSEMSGYVVVVPTPYFAVTCKDGSLRDQERSGRPLHVEDLERRGQAHHGPGGCCGRSGDRGFDRSQVAACPAGTGEETDESAQQTRGPGLAGIKFPLHAGLSGPHAGGAVCGSDRRRAATRKPTATRALPTRWLPSAGGFAAIPAKLPAAEESSTRPSASAR